MYTKDMFVYCCLAQCRHCISEHCPVDNVHCCPSCALPLYALTILIKMSNLIIFFASPIVPCTSDHEFYIVHDAHCPMSSFQAEPRLGWGYNSSSNTIWGYNAERMLIWGQITPKLAPDLTLQYQHLCSSSTHCRVGKGDHPEAREVASG